jgi:putative NIF3 family GTP cyclohydrolase 1 type 2
MYHNDGMKKGGTNVALLSDVERALNGLFRVKELGPDPGFSRFVPGVYDPIGFDWKSVFEPEFNQLFNGLMIRGAERVHRVFLAVFPTEEVLEAFLDESDEGDLLFLHHPLTMECGDPRGEWGRGFVPVDGEWWARIREKGLSVYTCHVPMDIHPTIGTNAAIVEALEARETDTFFRNQRGAYGRIAEIGELDTDILIARLQEIFAIPYVDLEGKKRSNITRIAIVAGCGDVVAAMKEAEEKGAQAYVTGEIHCRVDNDYGRRRFREMMDYVPTTSMSLIGVSHAASEFLVMKTQMRHWFERECQVATTLLEQSHWWR